MNERLTRLLQLPPEFQTNTLRFLFYISMWTSNRQLVSKIHLLIFFSLSKPLLSLLSELNLSKEYQGYAAIPYSELGSVVEREGRVLQVRRGFKS